MQEECITFICLFSHREELGVLPLGDLEVCQIQLVLNPLQETMFAGMDTSS